MAFYEKQYQNSKAVMNLFKTAYKVCACLWAERNNHPQLEHVSCSGNVQKGQAED